MNDTKQQREGKPNTTKVILKHAVVKLQPIKENRRSKGQIELNADYKQNYKQNLTVDPSKAKQKSIRIWPKVFIMLIYMAKVFIKMADKEKRHFFDRRAECYCLPHWRNPSFIWGDHVLRLKKFHALASAARVVRQFWPPKMIKRGRVSEMLGSLMPALQHVLPRLCRAFPPDAKQGIFCNRDILWAKQRLNKSQKPCPVKCLTLHFITQRRWGRQGMGRGGGWHVF